MIATVVARVLPLLAKHIDFSFLVKIVPQLKYIDKISKYVLDENELDKQNKLQQVEIDFLKDQSKDLWKEIEKLKKGGK
tara:strand:+ start:388 stop:624 length:237 start_codon:yes stop_codon:yes gene_type:complete